MWFGSGLIWFTMTNTLNRFKPEKEYLHTPYYLLSVLFPLLHVVADILEQEKV